MGLMNYISKVFDDQKNGKFEYIYILVDIHNTTLVPSFNQKEKFIFYPYAKETLQLLTSMKNVKLIMWSSTYDDKLKMYNLFFQNIGIHFNYINCNPEIGNSSFGCFNVKFFFDIGLDDKFGFDPYTDWQKIYNLIAV